MKLFLTLCLMIVSVVVFSQGKLQSQPPSKSDTLNLPLKPAQYELINKLKTQFDEAQKGAQKAGEAYNLALMAIITGTDVPIGKIVSVDPSPGKLIIVHNK